MAKGSLHIDGLDDILSDFNRVVGDIEKESVSALNESLTEIEVQMKNNARSVFTDGYTKGVMVNSISHTVSIKDGMITASVGVYDMSNKTGSAHRKIPEPIIAYWYEFGIQPHSTSPAARAANKGRKARLQTGRMHQGSPPKMFLSNAFDSRSENIITTIAERLNKSIDNK